MSSDVDRQPSAAPVEKSEGPQQLPEATRGRMESGFGQGFGDVQVHANSNRTGSALAHATGSELHFAPGHYQPGTQKGDWLIGHELAHVVQQRNGTQGSVQQFNPGAQRGMLEAEADRAASAVASGGRANVTLGAEAGSVQKYEAWEHTDLGDVGGGLTVRVGQPPPGVEVTYGEVVALSGDFYPSAKALYSAPVGELQKILAVMRKEHKEAKESEDSDTTVNKLLHRDQYNMVWDRMANDGKGGYVKVYGAPTGDQQGENNADYDVATYQRTKDGGPVAIPPQDGRDPKMLPHHEGHEEETGEDDHDHGGGVGAAGPIDGAADWGNNPGTPEQNNRGDKEQVTDKDGFTDLATKNSSHFSPENIRQNWWPRHHDALVMAQKAYNLKHPESQKAPPKKADVKEDSGPVPQDNPDKDKKNVAAHDEAAKAIAAGKDATKQFMAGSKGDTSEANEQAQKALIMSGFSVHFLTDAFASGHLISGAKGRELAEHLMPDKKAPDFTKLRDSLKGAAAADFKVTTWVANHLKKGQGDKLAGEAVDKLLDIMINAKGMKAISGLLLKGVHDTYNASGLNVRNKAGAEWRTYGDGNLARSPETKTQAQAAAASAEKSVVNAVDKGEWKETDDPDGAYGAYRFVPNQVQMTVKSPDGKFKAGPWKTVQEFATSEENFKQEYENTAMTTNPDENRVYQVIKGGVVPTLKSLAREKGIDITGVDPGKDKTGFLKKLVGIGYDKAKAWGGEKVDQAKKWGGEEIDKAKQWGSEKVDEAKSAGKSAWDWAGKKYDGAKKSVSDGASSAWGWAKSKYQGAKETVKEDVAAGEKKVSDGVQSVKDGAKKKAAGWVDELFKSKAQPANQGSTPDLQQGEPSKVDSGTASVDPVQNQTYAHGAFMGAAGELMKDPAWNGIFKTLMPPEYAKAQAMTDAKSLIAFMENNPVMAAYGSAMAMKGQQGQGDHDANPKEGKPTPLEWDVWLDPQHPEDISKAKIAHGDKGTTVAQHAVQNLPVGFVRDDIKHAPSSTDWMNTFGRAIALWRGQGQVKNPDEADQKQKAIEQVAKVDDAETAIKICAQFLQAPSGLILDVKSTYSKSSDINAFVATLKNKYGINVFGVGTFKFDQLNGLSDGIRRVKFFHSVDGVLHAAHEAQGKDADKAPLQKGDHLMFNAGSLLKEKKAHFWSKAKGYELDQTALQKLIAVQRQFDLNIALYVQEPDVGSDAIQLITQLVNKMPSVFREGFSYGNLSGKAESKTSGSGIGVQKVPAEIEKAESLGDSL